MKAPTEPGPIDADLLGRLLDEHGPALALYAAQWTDAADDCVQEALVELARQPALPANLRAWLYRVVKNRALNAARGARRRRERETRAAGERLLTKNSSSVDREELLAIVGALESLTGEERELVIMRIWGALGFDEIATALAKSTSTVHRQYHQALEKLRQIVEPPCKTNENPTRVRSPKS